MTWRLLKALAWLRWRLLVNGLTTAGRRGGLERASRWIEVGVPVALVLLALPVSLGLAGVAVGAGWLLAARPDARPVVATVATLILILPVVWIVLRPLLGAFGERSEPETPLRLLPIPSALLARLALLQQAADPAFLLFAPAILALPFGALAAGRVLLAGAAAAAGLALLVFLLAAGALVDLAVKLLLRDRRRGEVVALLFFLLLGFAGVFPQFLQPGTHVTHSRSPAQPAPAPRFEGPELPWSGAASALRVSPPGLYGDALARAAGGEWVGAGGRVAALALVAAVGILAVPTLHRRLTETPASAPRTGRARAAAATTVRLPFVTPATAAVAAVELKAALRTVRGRMALLFPPLFVAALAFAPIRGHASSFPFAGSPLALGALAVLMTVANVGVFSCNQFAVAGTGLILELLQPLGVVALVRGRALAFAGFSAIALALGLAPLLLVGPRVALGVLLAMYLGGLAVGVTVSPAAATISAVMPKEVDLGRIGRAGQPHAGASLAHMFVSGLAALPAAGCLALALVVWRKPWLAPLLTGAWLACTVVAASALLPLAARVVAARRDNLALVAMGR